MVLLVWQFHFSVLWLCRMCFMLNLFMFSCICKTTLKFAKLLWNNSRHNLFLHSALVLSRKIPRSVHGIKVNMMSIPPWACLCIYLRKALSLFLYMCMLIYSSSVQKCFDIKMVESLRVGSSSLFGKIIHMQHLRSCLLVVFSSVFLSLWTTELTSIITK